MAPCYQLHLDWNFQILVLKNYHLAKQYVSSYFFHIASCFSWKQWFFFSGLQKLWAFSYFPVQSDISHLEANPGLRPYLSQVWFKLCLTFGKKYWHELGELIKIKMLFKTEKQSWNLNYLEQLSITFLVFLYLLSDLA